MWFARMTSYQCCGGPVLGLSLLCLGFGILFGTLMQQMLVPALAILQMRAVDRFKRWFARGDAGEQPDAPLPG